MEMHPIRLLLLLLIFVRFVFIFAPLSLAISIISDLMTTEVHLLSVGTPYRIPSTSQSLLIIIKWSVYPQTRCTKKKKKTE